MLDRTGVSGATGGGSRRRAPSIGATRTLAVHLVAVRLGHRHSKRPEPLLALGRLEQHLDESLDPRFMV